MVKVYPCGAQVWDSSYHSPVCVLTCARWRGSDGESIIKHHPSPRAAHLGPPRRVIPGTCRLQEDAAPVTCPRHTWLKNILQRLARSSLSLLSLPQAPHLQKEQFIVLFIIFFLSLFIFFVVRIIPSFHPLTFFYTFPLLIFRS